MTFQRLVNKVELTKQFFDKSTGKLDEGDSAFAPAKGMFTAANQVAHTAQTIDWFLQGAFSDEGMDMDFVKHEASVRACTSLAEARAWLDRSVKALVTKLKEAPESEWEKPIGGSVLAGAPRTSIVDGIVEHTSHHRGALSVYQRLLGKVPEMPYA